MVGCGEGTVLSVFLGCNDKYTMFRKHVTDLAFAQKGVSPHGHTKENNQR
jgi:hypothetical protein